MFVLGFNIFFIILNFKLMLVNIKSSKAETSESSSNVFLQNLTTSETPSTFNDSSNTSVCTNNVPEKPNFYRPGLRTSEIKCAEYIWQMSYRDQVAKNKYNCLNGSLPDDVTLGVIGGRITRFGEFPHMGAIGWKATIGTWIFKCGSSLISPKFVLTAAHCTQTSDRDTTVADTLPKIVRFGDINVVQLVSLPNDYNIVRSLVHPLYESPKKYNDIALMELEREVLFTKSIQPACVWHLPETNVLGNKATVTGWGVLKAGSITSSPDLQVADVNIIDSKLCDELLDSHCNRHWCGLDENQLCAGNLTGGVDACQGDSGGPLQIKIPLPISSQGQMHYVIGITSFGFGCALENTPGVYTRVSSYIDWIESNVWP